MEVSNDIGHRACRCPPSLYQWLLSLRLWGEPRGQRLGNCERSRQKSALFGTIHDSGSIVYGFLAVGAPFFEASIILIRLVSSRLIDMLH